MQYYSGPWISTARAGFDEERRPKVTSVNMVTSVGQQSWESGSPNAFLTFEQKISMFALSAVSVIQAALLRQSPAVNH